MRPFALSLAVTLILFTALTGFHWISIGTHHERRLCVMTKERLSFDETFLSADSETTLSLEHPFFWTRLARGDAACIRL